MSIGYAGIGGIIGVANNWGEGVEISNCINYGEIKGVCRLGGIVGTSSYICKKIIWKKIKEK